MIRPAESSHPLTFAQHPRSSADYRPIQETVPSLHCTTPPPPYRPPSRQPRTRLFSIPPTFPNVMPCPRPAARKPATARPPAHTLATDMERPFSLQRALSESYYSFYSHFQPWHPAFSTLHAPNNRPSTTCSRATTQTPMERPQALIQNPPTSIPHYRAFSLQHLSTSQYALLRESIGLRRGPPRKLTIQRLSAAAAGV